MWTMPRTRQVVTSLLLGVGAGTVILGIGGRLTMSGIALVTSGHARFSLAGSLEVVLVGAINGAVGGVLLLPLRQLVQTGPLFRGVALGLILFGIALVIEGPGPPFILALAAAMLALYGIVVDVLFVRLARRRDQARAETPGTRDTAV